MFLALLVRFLSDDDGAVSVDYVILTAGVITLGILVVYPIKGSLIETAVSIADWLTGYEVASADISGQQTGVDQ